MPPLRGQGGVLSGTKVFHSQCMELFAFPIRIDTRHHTCRFLLTAYREIEHVKPPAIQAALSVRAAASCGRAADHQFQRQQQVWQEIHDPSMGLCAETESEELPVLH